MAVTVEGRGRAKVRLAQVRPRREPGRHSRRQRRPRVAAELQSLQVGERGEPRRNLALQRVAGGGEGAEGREAGEGGRQRAEAVVVDGKAAQGRGVAERGVGVEALDSVVGGQEHLPGAG